jgi:hypothetical protein
MKEKPKNKTVAMRFRLKNFKEIEPILKKHKIKTETILNVTEYPYLISHRYRNKLSVHNETLTHGILLRFMYEPELGHQLEDRVVEVDEGFDRAWRRVGLALDRVGFTVEDRDRVRGVYFVRYIDQEGDAKNKASSGFFSRLFSSKDDKKQAVRYQIQVKSAGERTRISVLNEQGAPAVEASAGRILALLGEQLR